jgi:hypothetical protein
MVMNDRVAPTGAGRASGRTLRISADAAVLALIGVSGLARLAGARS